MRSIWEGNSDRWNILYQLWWFYKNRTKVEQLTSLPRILGTSHLASFLVDYCVCTIPYESTFRYVRRIELLT